VIPTDTIDTLDAVFTSLSQLGATLDEAAWKSPTDCPGWTVQDHLSHLIGIERMLEGLPGAEVELPPSPHVKNPIGEMNEREVEARRARTGAEVLAEWDEIAARRLATLRAADDAYFAQETMTPTGPGTIADFLHIRVLDCWVHEQDMRRATGHPGNLAGPAAEHTIDRLIRTIPIVVGKRARTPEGATVVLRLTGPVERTIPVTVVDGRAKVVDAVAGDAAADISMDSEAFVVLATGRAEAGALADRWSVTGDRALGEAVVTNLNMMI
jgi:uncharacterized protein (TIGR03083 family)